MQLKGITILTGTRCPACRPGTRRGSCCVAATTAAPKAAEVARRNCTARRYHKFDYSRATIVAARNAQVSHDGLRDGRITPTTGKLRHLLDISVDPRKRRRSGGMN